MKSFFLSVHHHLYSIWQVTVEGLRSDYHNNEQQPGALQLNASLTVLTFSTTTQELMHPASWKNMWRSLVISHVRKSASGGGMSASNNMLTDTSNQWPTFAYYITSVFVHCISFFIERFSVNNDDFLQHYQEWAGYKWQRACCCTHNLVMSALQCVGSLWWFALIFNWFRIFSLKS